MHLIEISERRNTKIPGGENRNGKGEAIFEKIMAENFPELNKDGLKRHIES